MTAIRLSYPVKALWPNGRAHRMAKARAVKAARQEAWAATLSVRNSITLPEGDILLGIVLHPKPRGPVPDKDNTASALKAHFDGIADALKVNDRRFIPQPVEIGERKPGGEVVIRVLGARG